MGNYIKISVLSNYDYYEYCDLKDKSEWFRSKFHIIDVIDDIAMCLLEVNTKEDSKRILDFISSRCTIVNCECCFDKRGNKEDDCERLIRELTIDDLEYLMKEEMKKQTLNKIHFDSINGLIEWLRLQSGYKILVYTI